MSVCFYFVYHWLYSHSPIVGCGWFRLYNLTTSPSVFLVVSPCQQEAPRECEIIICATKVDLPHAQWEVSEEDFTAYANSMKLNIFTASAQSGHNVEEVFYALARQVLEKQRPVLMEMRESESDTRESAVVFDNIPKKKKSGCC